MKKRLYLAKAMRDFASKIEKTRIDILFPNPEIYKSENDWSFELESLLESYPEALIFFQKALNDLESAKLNFAISALKIENNAN